MVQLKNLSYIIVKIGFVVLMLKFELGLNCHYIVLSIGTRMVLCKRPAVFAFIAKS